MDADCRRTVDEDSQSQYASDAAHESSRYVGRGDFLGRLMRFELVASYSQEEKMFSGAHVVVYSKNAEADLRLCGSQVCNL